MTWREKVVVRILLLVARMLCDDPRVAEEIKNLATHVNVDAPEPAETPAGRVYTEDVA